MSDFKIVCGINPKAETIINLDKVKEIVLDDEYIENSMCVTIYGTDGDIWHFETDLIRLSDVLKCITLALSAEVDFSEVIFSQKALISNLEIMRANALKRIRGNAL